MNVHPEPTLFDADEFLLQQERKSQLRFIVCGSVDHGKSTLIGRLLYEAGLLFADQLDALDHDSRRHGTQGDELDFALLLDGLAAEREQKITIDVAYRFFSTVRRKFIVADAPGHEQYTRNMATGASTADLALLLVSAADGLTLQTKRHAVIVSTLGVRRFVVAVNKMDLIDWSESRFVAIEAELRALAKSLDVDDIVCIPLSARDGDNVVFRSERMPWYRGPTLLEHLEEVECAAKPPLSPFRMPIQWVNRPDSAFRGYCGQIASGDVYPGMAVQVMPSGQYTRIRRIVTADGDLAHAVAGAAVALTFADEVDASRGDMAAGISPSAPITNRLRSRIVWVGKDALIPGRPYLLKLATATAKATVEPNLGLIDLETQRATPADRLVANDIGTAIVALDRLVAVDRYADCRETGSFILIDPESFDTIGMGIVEATHPDEIDRQRAPSATNLCDIMRTTESHARSIAKAISWRATGSIDTFIVAAIITGSSSLAGGVALAEVLTKTALYYLHERVWALIRWGKR
jgi:sulfate adenylyltransferase large subunit